MNLFQSYVKSSDYWREKTNNSEKFSPLKKNKEKQVGKNIHTHTHKCSLRGKQRKSILSEEHFNSDYFKVLWMDIGATPAAASLPDPA